MVAHAFIFSVWKAEAGGWISVSVRLKLAYLHSAFQVNQGYIAETWYFFVIVVVIFLGAVFKQG